MGQLQCHPHPVRHRAGSHAARRPCRAPASRQHASLGHDRSVYRCPCHRGRLHAAPGPRHAPCLVRLTQANLRFRLGLRAASKTTAIRQQSIVTASPRSYAPPALHGQFFDAGSPADRCQWLLHGPRHDHEYDALCDSCGRQAVAPVPRLRAHVLFTARAITNCSRTSARSRNCTNRSIPCSESKEVRTPIADLRNWVRSRSLSSCPGEFHPQALPEPCMTLSSSHGSRCSAVAMA